MRPDARKLGLNEAIGALAKELADPKGKYAPKNKKTFCNLYAHDVLKLMGISLPIYVNEKAKVKWLTANDQFEYLTAEAAKGTEWDRYIEANLTFAVRRIHDGDTGVVCYYNGGGHGHIAVLVPAIIAGVRSVRVSQAGAKCGTGYTLREAFGTKPIQYFVHRPYGAVGND